MTLRWSAPKGAEPEHYVVLRDGKSLGKTARRSYTDHKVQPGRTYRYTVRALDERNRAGALSRSVRVTVPKKPTAKLPGPSPSTNLVEPVATVTPTPQLSPPAATPTATPTPTPSPQPTPTPEPVVTLTEAMVDRLFWRAGFGPSQAQRDAWTGRSPDELVDWFLDTPVSQEPTATPPLTMGNLAIDAKASDIELELEWLDRMQRAVNPLPDRLAFFWHRHWAISRDDGIPYVWVVGYRDRLLSYADFATSPTATFRALALEMTTLDPAMSMYLNLNQNVKGKPNENYAREFMELFCLGPKGADGTDNYLQADVETLARALTGWKLQNNVTLPNYGGITFTANNFDIDRKVFSEKFLNKTIPAMAKTEGLECVKQAIDIVLAHPSHAQFLIRKLWAEFIASPIPQEALDALVSAYTSSNLQLRPVLRGILTHPLIFESIDEPNLIKPPIVYLVGVLRQLGVPLKHDYMQGAMINMQQRIYRPPNVAGWEGGMSWLNTNTVQGRFDLIVRAQFLKYSNNASSYPRAALVDVDNGTETPQSAFDRAYASVNKPWLSASTRTALLSYATTAPVTSAALRRQRIYALQALMLGGPDGQVM